MTKREALEAAATRAKAAGSTARGLALLPFMTDEERAAYYRGETEAIEARRVERLKTEYTGSYAAACAHFGCSVKRVAGGLGTGSPVTWKPIRVA